MILMISPGGPEKAATAREIVPGLNGASGVTGVGAVVVLKVPVREDSGRPCGRPLIL
jgi:hypothetical protein